MFVECRAEYRTTGPEHLRCVGETEFVAGIAQASARRAGSGSNGRAVISCDHQLLQSFAVDGKPPRSAIIVTITATPTSPTSSGSSKCVMTIVPASCTPRTPMLVVIVHARF